MFVTDKTMDSVKDQTMMLLLHGLTLHLCSRRMDESLSTHSTGRLGNDTAADQSHK